MPKSLRSTIIDSCTNFSDDAFIRAWENSHLKHKLPQKHNRKDIINVSLSDKDLTVLFINVIRHDEKEKASAS